MTDEQSERTDETPLDATGDDSATEAERDLPADPLFRELAERHEDVTFATFPSASGPDQDVATVSAEGYHELIASLKDAGFDVFIDLCGVDYLRRRPRFEVVVTLLSHELRRRIRVRVGLTTTEPRARSITDLFPGANFFERETYDLFGIVFDGHSDLTRILLPDDWEGYPLRKDYPVGSVPVQFKGSPHVS